VLIASSLRFRPNHPTASVSLPRPDQSNHAVADHGTGSVTRRLDRTGHSSATVGDRSRRIGKAGARPNKPRNLLLATSTTRQQRSAVARSEGNRFLAVRAKEALRQRRGVARGV